MTPRSTGVAGLLAAATVALAAVACGGESPGQAAPVLRDRLSAVDSDLARHDYAAARRDLGALSQVVDEARSTGRITSDQADRIDAAVTRLAGDLAPDHASPTSAPAPPSTTGHDDGKPTPGPGPGHRGKHRHGDG